MTTRKPDLNFKNAGAPVPARRRVGLRAARVAGRGKQLISSLKRTSPNEPERGSEPDDSGSCASRGDDWSRRRLRQKNGGATRSCLKGATTRPSARARRSARTTASTSAARTTRRRRGPWPRRRAAATTRRRTSRPSQRTGGSRARRRSAAATPREHSPRGGTAALYCAQVPSSPSRCCRASRAQVRPPLVVWRALTSSA